MIVSNCCGAAITNTDFDICPECLEHCDFEEDEEEEEIELDYYEGIAAKLFEFLDAREQAFAFGGFIEAIKYIQSLRPKETVEPSEECSYGEVLSDIRTPLEDIEPQQESKGVEEMVFTQEEMDKAKGKWISVGDRLPKESEDVLMCYDDDIIYCGFHTSEGWHFAEEGERVGGLRFITHWRPLPSPPKTQQP